MAGISACGRRLLLVVIAPWRAAEAATTRTDATRRRRRRRRRARTPRPARPRRRPARRAACGCAASASFDVAGVRDVAARRPRAPVRRRAGRPRPGHPRRPHARRRRSSTSATRSPPAASRACSRSPSRPTTRTSGLFYVYFTDTDGDQRDRRVPRAATPTAPTPARRGSCCGWPTTRATTTAACSLFGPDDLLYVGTGDGGGGGDQHGSRGNAQDLGSLLGKILRIDPRAERRARRTRVPAATTRSSAAPARAARSTPTACATRGASRSTAGPAPSRSATSARTSGRRSTTCARGGGRGANFGWRPFEGRARYTPGESAPGHVQPVIVRSHGDGNCSITGGVVVRDRDVPALRGRYVFGDFCKGRVESARARGRPRARRAEHLAAA